MKRTIPGILLALGWVLLLLLGDSALFYGAMVVITAIAAHEYLAMIFREHLGLSGRAYLLSTLALPVALCWPGADPALSRFGVFLSFFLITLYFIRRYTQFENTYERFSRMGFGLLYVGMLASYLLLIRYLPQGGGWLVVLSAVTAGSDSGAYYFGSTFGRRKLCVSISPKKTIEGALGGLLCGVLLALVCALLVLEQVNWPFLVLVTVLLTGVGILGDLAESIIKRGTGTKDSGRLLAGHGGVLDRIDSLLLASPVLYYLLLFFGG